MTIIEAEKVPEPNLTVDKTTETEQETSTEENTDANFEPQEIQPIGSLARCCQSIRES